jgi:hypothetical protein
MKSAQAYKTFVLLGIFSMAMAFLESAVVVYLREIYYPEGFSFPIVPASGTIAVTEVVREAATLVMLLVVAYLVSNTLSEGIAWFIYCFAVWDIFYYIFLKFLINWPDSLLTWDVLFLIPMVWTGPVVAPLIVSLTMILLTVVIIRFRKRDRKLNLNRTEWILLVGGTCILFLSFINDFARYLLQHQTFPELLKFRNHAGTAELLGSYVPMRFNWILFLAGEMMIVVTTILLYWRSRK